MKFILNIRHLFLLLLLLFYSKQLPSTMKITSTKPELIEIQTTMNNSDNSTTDNIIIISTISNEEITKIQNTTIITSTSTKLLSTNTTKSTTKINKIKKELSIADCLTDILLILLIVILIGCSSAFAFLLIRFLKKPKETKKVGNDEDIEKTVVVEDGLLAGSKKEENKANKFMALKTVGMEVDEGNIEDLGQTGLTNISKELKLNAKLENAHIQNDLDKDKEEVNDKQNEEQHKNRGVEVVPETVNVDTNEQKTENEEENGEILSNEKNEPDWDDSDEDFDAIYDLGDDDSETIKNEDHGSVFMHLLSQLSIGMDLGKVTLPTFILERRSLLEMYSEFFAHPDDFISAINLNNQESRFLSIVKYYINSFYPARKSGLAKKPYNPILGESFRCRWTLPGTVPSKQKTRKGPFPGTGTNQVTFIAEQVSHHPPVSAFYAEHPEAGVSCNGYIHTKSSFLGLSVVVHHIGNATITLHKYDEQYVVTFPSAYGRSIMSTPWIELGGKVEIHCEKTQYRAEIEFLTKTIFRGKAHQIQGNIFFGYSSKKPIIHLKGEWNSKIYMKKSNGGDYQLFTNVLEKNDVNKECIPVMKQEERESRRLWRHVTVALFRDNTETATQAKQLIEQRQREEKIERDKEGIQWKTRFFEKVGDSWRYKEFLGDRINDS